jgi:uncharacterized protein YdeI (YjbR/CyaY-like superfamily)
MVPDIRRAPSISPLKIKKTPERRKMEVTKTLYVTNREDWRNWLEEHYGIEKEIWLVYYRKETGFARIPYNEAVEEALCFGWIDSIIKSLDEERTVQRFSPRQAKSEYSQANKERLKRLIQQGKVIPEIITSLADVDLDQFEYPADIMTAIRENQQAWENYQSYSGSYRRIRIAYIDSGRRRPGEYEKRLRHFIRMTEVNTQFGFGIEDY